MKAHPCLHRQKGLLELVIGNGVNIRIVSGTIFELNYGQN